MGAPVASCGTAKQSERAKKRDSKYHRKEADKGRGGCQARELDVLAIKEDSL